MATRLSTRRPAVASPRADARPALVVAPEVVRAIATATFAADPFETGGPLLGTVERSWTGTDLVPLVSVLGTVLPAAGTRGDLGSVSLGERGEGERAASALRWLRTTTGLDLVHLGDWHAHPSGACRPSRGDVKTAVAMAAESGAPVWLTAISLSGDELQPGIFARGDAASYRRDRLETAGVRFFRVVERGLVPLPARIDGSALPRLPPLPWHVADAARFAAECRLLAAAGFRVGIDASPNGEPGLALRVQREGGAPLTIRTGLDYPARTPELRDERGRLLAPQDPLSPDRFLVDLVREVSS
jgi:hypothetical protein